MDDQENLERTWKVREKSENSKIIGYGRQSSEELFILSKRRKDVHSREIVLSHLPPHWGLLLKKRICSHGEQIFSIKSNPQIRSDTVNTIKVKNKDDFFGSVRGYGKLKCQGKSGKSQEIFKWMISGNPVTKGLFSQYTNNVNI